MGCFRGGRWPEGVAVCALSDARWEGQKWGGATHYYIRARTILSIVEETGKKVSVALGDYAKLCGENFSRNA